MSFPMFLPVAEPRRAEQNVTSHVSCALIGCRDVDTRRHARRIGPAWGPATARESRERETLATQVTASRRLSLSHVTRHHARHTPHGTTAGAGEQTRLIILFNLALFIYTIRGHNIGHMYMCHADAYEATSLATDFRGSVTRQLYYTASHTP
jgi:hypothetical protein